MVNAPLLAIGSEKVFVFRDSDAWLHLISQPNRVREFAEISEEIQARWEALLGISQHHRQASFPFVMLIVGILLFLVAHYML